MEHSYNFSVLQLSPFRYRGERVNIGVVVFLPDTLDVRLISSWKKVLALRSDMDLDNLSLLPAELNAWTKGITDIDSRRSLISNFGTIDLTPTSTFLVSEGIEYENQLAHLMQNLVEAPPIRRKLAGRGATLTAELRNVFSDYGLLSRATKDIQKHLVVQHFPISAREGLIADFAVKNSIYHITKTVDFRQGQVDSKSKVREVSFSAVVLDQSLKILGAKTKRYFVYTSSGESRRALTPHLDLIAQYADRIVNYSTEKDRKAYISTMLEASGHTSLTK